MTTAHPGVSWQKIGSMRNVLAHPHGLVAYEIVYETVADELPVLLKKLEKRPA